MGINNRDFRFKPFPVLQTQRLELRRLTNDDAWELLLLRSNSIVNEFIDRPLMITFGEAETFIRLTNDKIDRQEVIYWAVVLKENKNRVIGTICLWNLSYEHELGELGYELHPDLHAKGFMQEAVEAVIKYGFEKMKLRTITALPQKENARSIQLLKRNRFRLDNNFNYVNENDAEGYWVYYKQIEK